MVVRHFIPAGVTADVPQLDPAQRSGWTDNVREDGIVLNKHTYHACSWIYTGSTA